MDRAIKATRGETFGAAKLGNWGKNASGLYLRSLVCDRNADCRLVAGARWCYARRREDEGERCPSNVHRRATRSRCVVGGVLPFLLQLVQTGRARSEDRRRDR